MKCLICGEENNKLGNHVKRRHNINAQEYYDQYIGKHYCPVCGKETVFRSINQGYLTYCSIHCADLEKSIFKTNNPQKDSKIKQKTKNTNLLRYGVTNTFQIKDVKEKCIKNNHTPEALKKRSANLYKNFRLSQKNSYFCIQTKNIIHYATYPIRRNRLRYHTQRKLVLR